MIFDGGLPGGFSRTMSTVDIGVVFAARYHTNADRIIDERLKACPMPQLDRRLPGSRGSGSRPGQGRPDFTAQEFAVALERPPSQEKLQARRHLGGRGR